MQLQGARIIKDSPVQKGLCDKKRKSGSEPTEATDSVEQHEHAEDRLNQKRSDQKSSELLAIKS